MLLCLQHIFGYVCSGFPHFLCFVLFSCPPGHYRAGPSDCARHDDCFWSNVCLNGGTCVRTPETLSAECRCPAGFTGPLCERAATELPFTLAGDRNFIIIIILAIMSLLSKSLRRHNPPQQLSEGAWRINKLRQSLKFPVGFKINCFFTDHTTYPQSSKSKF